MAKRNTTPDGGMVPAYVQKQKPVTKAPLMNWKVNPNQLPKAKPVVQTKRRSRVGALADQVFGFGLTAKQK